MRRDFLRHLVSIAWILFFFSFFVVVVLSPESASRVCFTSIEDGGDKRLVELELACQADGIAPPDSF